MKRSRETVLKGPGKKRSLQSQALPILKYSMGSWKERSRPSISSGKILSSPFPTWSVSRTDSISSSFWSFRTNSSTHIGSYAHVLLPGVSFAEKEGTFTSMERRIQRVRQAIAPVGEARPDWKILCDLSTRMGYPMTYQNPAEVMEEIASLVPSYAGATYSNLEKDGIQWPSDEWKEEAILPGRNSGAGRTTE